MNKKKVGLFFGTFDPIHNGHLKIAEYIIEEKLNDEVWLVVTPENPIKQDSKISNFCLLYTSPSPRDKRQSRMPSSA